MRGSTERLLQAFAQGREIDDRHVVRQIRLAGGAHGQRALGGGIHAWTREGQLREGQRIVRVRAGDLSLVDLLAGDRRRSKRRGSVQCVQHDRTHGGNRQRHAHIRRAVQHRIGELAARSQQRSRQLVEGAGKRRRELTVAHLHGDVRLREVGAGQCGIDEIGGGAQHERVDGSAAAVEREAARQQAAEPVVGEPRDVERQRESMRVETAHLSGG